MVNLIIFILVSISITNIIQNGTIFSPLRVLIKNYNEKIYNFIICSTCFGFHIGWLLSFFLPLNDNIILNMFICAFISSIINKSYVELMPETFKLD